MENYLLVINAGSSSVKFSVYKTGIKDGFETSIYGQVDGIGHSPMFKVSRTNGEALVDRVLGNAETDAYQGCLNVIFSWLLQFVGDEKLLAAGHRVVHGGSKYAKPALVDEELLDDLEHLIPLAPLHQPHNLQVIRTFRKIMPELPQVACFDTSFHQTQPKITQSFGLPRHFFDEGIRRYGFHGLSYEYIVSVLPSFDAALMEERVIVAHLGSGASLCAIRNGTSIATTMGFSPLDGLVMGTRCGSLDPGVLLYLMDRYGMGARELEELLYHRSGLLGVSGISDDMRTLLASDDANAREAVDLFVYRIVREIGSLVAALGGLDALVFTGGIGENSAEIRDRVCQDAAWLGLDLDRAANEETASRLISSHQSKIAIWVINTNENLMIAKQTYKHLVSMKKRA